MSKILISAISVAGLILLGFHSSYGAVETSRLTLSAAIATAQSNNPELKKSQLTADSANWGRLEALSEHLPHLGLSGTHALGVKYASLGVIFGGTAIQFPSAFPQTDFQIEASLLLFDGLGAINRYRASLLENEASGLELSHARFRLEELIQVKFHQALAAKELAKVADQNIETLEQHLRLAQANQRAGFSTKVDVLRIESQLEEAWAEKILATDNVEIARQSLIETMGLEKDERLLEGTLPFPDPKRLPENLTLVVTQRDDLQAQARREQAQDRISAGAGAFWLPKVSLFGVQQFYKFGSFDPAILPNSTFQSSYSYGLKMSWNLFDGGASIAKKARSDDNAKIATENLRKAMIASPNEFDVWKRRYIYNTALFNARTRAVEKSTESVRLATLAVKAGTKTNSETLDAELELFRARAGVIRAQMDASEALANLELALGHRI